MPALVGVEERDMVVHAIVTTYLIDAADGWDWYVDDVAAWLRGEVRFGQLVESARRMGAMAARLHSTLAGLQPTMVDLACVADRAMSDLHMATTALDNLGWLDAGTTATALQPLRSVNRVQGHRIHGDLHAGQFLRSGDTLVLTDFDGNPLMDSTERAQPQSPLRDLASMVQSIAHVGAVVVKRRCPDRVDDVERFVAAATAAALDTYCEVHPIDLDLLLAFRIAQELHEYAYSVHHLPHWRYVADAALPGLLGLR